MSNITPWERCGWCGKVVKINKPLFGSLHLCLTDEEKAQCQTQITQYQAMHQAQQQMMRGYK